MARPLSQSGTHFTPCDERVDVFPGTLPLILNLNWDNGCAVILSPNVYSPLPSSVVRRLLWIVFLWRDRVGMPYSSSFPRLCVGPHSIKDSSLHETPIVSLPPVCTQEGHHQHISIPQSAERPCQNTLFLSPPPPLLPQRLSYGGLNLPPHWIPWGRVYTTESMHAVPWTGHQIIHLQQRYVVSRRRLRDLISERTPRVGDTT